MENKFTFLDEKIDYTAMAKGRVEAATKNGLSEVATYEIENEKCIF